MRARQRPPTWIRCEVEYFNIRNTDDEFNRKSETIRLEAEWKIDLAFFIISISIGNAEFNIQTHGFGHCSNSYCSIRMNFGYLSEKCACQISASN